MPGVPSLYLEYYAPAVQRAHGGRKLRGLELGAGTGVAGLSFAFLGHHVILSDIGELQASATKGNIVQNEASMSIHGGSAQYEDLDWRNLPADRPRFGHFDIVFAGDVIWHETLVEPFVQAVSWCVTDPGVGEVLLSHKVRDEESMQLFEQLIGSAGLGIERKVSTDEVLGEEWGHPEVFMYHLRQL